MTDYANEPLYHRALEHALAYLRTLPERTTGARATLGELRAAIKRPLADAPVDAVTVLDDLVTATAPGIMSTSGPRFFGFVTGGSYPVSVAADWLTSVWDQPQALYVLSPALSVVEETAAAWLLELLRLPPQASVGFVTGAHTANFTALAAARHEVLRRAGWDVEAYGLQDAPRVDIVLGAQAHVSIYGALRMLGLGAKTVKVVPADEQGRMRAEDLPAVLATCEGPTIVCAQAGNVNTGAFDPLQAIAHAVAQHDGWLHVDGAFGLWAGASPSLRHHVDGVELADSWATDGHKWLNVPYDSGLVFVKHDAPHRAAMSLTAAYLVRGEGEERHAMDWVPESSRRARAVPVYVTLRALGRAGIAALVDRCCALARRMADTLRRHRSVRILNDVVLNQVLVGLVPDTGDADALIARVVSRVQQEGTCWVGGSSWDGRAAIRISVSNWGTTEADIDRSAEAILRAIDRERA